MLRHLDTDQVEWTPGASMSNQQSIDVFAYTHFLSSLGMIKEAMVLADSGSAAVLGCGRCRSQSSQWDAPRAGRCRQRIREAWNGHSLRPT
jgi:hypothetical protein